MSFLKRKKNIYLRADSLTLRSPLFCYGEASQLSLRLQFSTVKNKNKNKTPKN